jgi:hypothetical protein
MTLADRERLENEAYTVADLHRAGRLTRDEALRDLARECPGFTQVEYERAFAQGMHDSR